MTVCRYERDDDCEQYRDRDGDREASCAAPADAATSTTIAASVA